MELKLYSYVPVRKPPKLLIVPYGIETRKQSASGDRQTSFNCTLWN